MSVDRGLGFALWPGKPKWMIEPIIDQLDDRKLSELPPADATDVLELLAWLQPLRAGVVSVPILAIATVLDRSGAASGWSSVMWTLTLTLVLFIPIYGIALGIVRAVVARFPNGDVPIGKAHPHVVVVTHFAPVIAGALSLLVGVVAH